MYLRRFGSGAVVKRLGFLVETLELTHPPEPRMLDEWLDLRTAGISKLDPSTPREPHRIATRWRIEVNLPEEGLGGGHDSGCGNPPERASGGCRTSDHGVGLRTRMGPPGNRQATPTWPGNWSSRVGPACASSYFPDYRFSEDLDFTATRWFGWEELKVVRR